MPENSNIEEKSDEELVGLAIKDQAVFLHIMNRYQAKLLYYIKRISGLSNDEAEDVLQDVFIKIYQNLNDFDIDLKFSSWAYRITHNQVISNFRKIQARPQNAGIDLNDDSLRGLAADLDIEGKIDNSLLREKINKILNNLEYKYKE